MKIELGDNLTGLIKSFVKFLKGVDDFVWWFLGFALLGWFLA